MAQLDVVRTEKLHNAAIQLQRCARGFLARRAAARARATILLLQGAVRGLFARQLYSAMRRQQAAVNIQVGDVARAPAVSQPQSQPSTSRCPQGGVPAAAMMVPLLLVRRS